MVDPKVGKRACVRCGTSVPLSSLNRVPLGQSRDIEVCMECFEKAKTSPKERRDLKKASKKYRGFCRKCGYKFTTQLKTPKCPYCNTSDSLEISEGDYANTLVKEASNYNFSQ